MSGKRDVLEQLKRDELLDALDAFELEVVDRRVREQLVDALARARRAPLENILADLSRDRLKELCRALGLDDSGRAKAELLERLTGQPPAEPAPTAPEPTPPEPTPTPEAEPVHPRDETSPPATSEPLSGPPSIRGLLSILTKARLVALGRELGVAVASSVTREVQARTLAESGQITFRELLRAMGRDELKAACRAYDLDEAGRSRPDFARRLLQAHGDDTEPVKPLFSDEAETRTTPRVGDIAQVRHRQYLVEDVVAPAEDAGGGDPGAPRLPRRRQSGPTPRSPLGAGARRPRPPAPDPRPRRRRPARCAAPLRRLPERLALERGDRHRGPALPGAFSRRHPAHEPPAAAAQKGAGAARANLFIADDVGLGKTIEAGLVLQELQLRQRVDFVLIVCPAAICLQWRDEMARRFGLHFELYNRAFVGRRRQERGFQVNPWDTHNRFVISYPTLRRPEYREPPLRHLGERTRKSLLVLDEAHTAAPATAASTPSTPG